MVTLDEIRELKGPERSAAMRKYRRGMEEARIKDKEESLLKSKLISKFKNVKLAWMNIIRRHRSAGCSEEETLARLWLWGLKEEKRITEEFDRRLNNGQDGQMAGEPERGSVETSTEIHPECSGDGNYEQEH